LKANYREALGRAFVSLGETNNELMVVTADVSKSTRSIEFKNKFPDRFLSVGIAEANAVGISAGIASFGIPVIFTAYAVFATEKPFEQIRNMIAYPGLNVTIVATHGGINVGQDGVTHQAVEDIAIMRAIPTMTVLTVADPGEIKAALRAAIAHNGPVYVRIPRAPYEVIHDDPDIVDYEIGKAEVLREGSDLTIIATGMLVWDSLRAAERLAKNGVEARVINIRSIKPLDRSTIISAAQETGAIVTAEDHNRFGGLGGAIAELLVETVPTPMEQVALNDTFAESGDGYELLTKYELDTDAIYKKSQKVLTRKNTGAPK
jgi:transketolase